MTGKGQAMQNQTLYAIIAVIILAVVAYFVWQFYQGADDTGQYIPKDLSLAISACRNYGFLDSSVSFCEYREMEVVDGGKVYANCNYVHEIARQNVDEELGFDVKSTCQKDATTFCLEKSIADLGSFRADTVKVADGKSSSTNVNSCEVLLKKADEPTAKGTCREEGQKVYYEDLVDQTKIKSSSCGPADVNQVVTYAWALRTDCTSDGKSIDADALCTGNKPNANDVCCKTVSA